jgi:HAE1 family hydrophobic/amphiphilic exporter-1
MENIVVGSYNGANVFLRDVARVVDTVEERAQETYNNGVKGAMIIIQKQSGANSVEISRKVQEALPKLQKSLPSDVKLGVIVDTSDNILNTIDSLVETVFYALLFVVIVVFLFLGRWRATLIICITIPLSLIASFIYLAMSGNTINIISLSSLSIAIGMVVDDAIVVLENVTTHIERGSDPRQAAVHGTNEVAISVIASTLTMIAVFFPLTMVSGMSGVLFRQLGWMMCAIMFVSTTSALSLTPMLCSQLLRLQKKQSKAFTVLFTPINRALDGLDNWYARMLNWAVRHRGIVLAACFGFMFLSFFCAKFIGTEFFPAQDNGRIAVKLELPIGTRKELAQELADKLTKQWREKYPGVVMVCNYTVGQADSDNTWASMQDNGSHIISFNIRLCDPGDRDITQTQVCDEMREDLKAYPEFSKAQVIYGGSTSGMSAQSTADFEVYGYSLEETDRIAAELKEKLLNVKGVTEVNISRSDYQPEFHVDFDREKLALHGLNLTTAANYLRNRINGSTASYYREDGDEYDIKVRYAPEFRQSIESLENILIYNSRGESVRVRDVGKVVERFNPPTIERKDRERIVTVSAVISGAPLGDVVAEGNKIIDKMDIPGEISVQIAGSYEDQQDSFHDLGTLAVLIIILVFIVMAAQFESMTYPFILILSVLFSISGVLMALFITNTTLSIMSLLGAIMLIGIVVKNGIVLIDYTILCRERGQSILNAVVTAGKSRLRPVLMTTATTVLGMVPMALSTGQGAEMWSPMAIAVIGGLTVSTILTLIYVPTMYCVFGGVGVKNRRKKMRKQRELEEYYDEHKSEMINMGKK